mmetsp:Transcript_107391/g.149717  ORF Transcript_107391/g.149717 Transcript_107391/m.149717 type:complete len:140 (-) Transcript_107391:105-524(-)
MVSVGTLEKRRFVLKCFKESWEHERVVAFFSTRSMVEAWLTLGEESLPEDPEIEGSKRTWERAFYTYRKKILSLSYLIDFHEILKAESFRQSSLLHQEVHVPNAGRTLRRASTYSDGCAARDRPRAESPQFIHNEVVRI